LPSKRLNKCFEGKDKLATGLPITMSIEIIIVIAALIISWLVFTWLVKVLKASIGTAIAIAIIVLILQLAFGIGPQQLWQQIVNLPQTIQQLLSN
jgi:glycerol-3-phosphate acyltransferase PlsY